MSSTIMRFNITDEIDVTGVEATINAEPAGPVSTIDLGYDVALVLLANGLEGNYTQDQTDIETVVSNLSIDQGEFNRGRMLLVTGAGSQNLDAMEEVLMVIALVLVSSMVLLLSPRFNFRMVPMLLLLTLNSTLKRLVLP